ncbi:hypothetical protein SAMN06314042_11510 [Epsilonproteobacteria bacterium SCGC AD-308-O04]|jgi:WD40 repeat protein|nr:hypothetical protein SAMN06314042_11510 [Epsilonproteobacteria bacterium SCGC AD-308-O04]
MIKILILSLFISSLFSANIMQPTSEFKSSGAVVDIVYTAGKLYSATDASCVDIFDFQTKKIIKKIKVDQITDFMGDIIDSKVYSVDVIKDKVLLLSQAKEGARRVHIYTNDSLNLIIPYSEKLLIAKAKFLDENTILLALLGSELISYDVKNKKINYRTQVSQSKFSNFALNETKTQVVVADESGDLKIYNTKDGVFVKKLSGQNLDNVFQVDYKNSIIATAGQDRKVVIYDTKSNSAYYKMGSFLIYSAGLSPSAKLAGYSSDENNNVTVFNTSTQSILGVFGGNKMTLTNILFINEEEFLVSSDDNTINLYKIK